MSVELQFEKVPQVSLWKVLVGRKSGLREGDTLPRVQAAVKGLSAQECDAYQRVCGFPKSPWLPLTFPQVAATPLHLAMVTHASFPLPAMGLVHVSNQITQFRPIRQDEALDLSCHVEGYRTARKGVEIDFHTAIDVAGERVWEGISTALSTAGPGDGIKRDRTDPPPIRPQRSTTWSLPADQGRQYAQVSRDHNPIHLYAWAAKLFGFKRTLVHGMWTLARCMAELDQDIPNKGVRVDVSFRRPVFLPSRVSFTSGKHNDNTVFQVSDLSSHKLCLEGQVSAAPSETTRAILRS